jgi:hypothetical protein
MSLAISYRVAESFHVGRLPTALVVACCLHGCSSLLDIPSDPRLVDDSAAEAGESEASIGAGAADAPSSPPPGSLPSPRGNVDSEVTGEADSLELPTSPSAPSSSGDVGASGPQGSDAGTPLPGPVLESEDPPPESEDPPPAGCAVSETLGPDGACYTVVEALESWQDARSNCRARGAGWDLASIRSDAINQLMVQMLSGEAWIGGSDAASEGIWRWVDDGAAFWLGNGATGRALNGAYENWNTDEPNGGGNSACVRLVTTALAAPHAAPAWADLECFELLRSVCKGPAR